MRQVGADTIGHYEHLIASQIGRVIPDAVKDAWGEVKRWDGVVWAEMKERVGQMGWRWGGFGGGKEKEKGEGASLGTQLALAYAIHKSFIFVRVPATIAVTPKFVKVLREWGWNIGRRK